MTTSVNLGKIAKQFSYNQLKEMRIVCIRDISFVKLVSERTKVQAMGDWYGVRCEFHTTSTLDAGRLRDHTNGVEGAYFCNNPICSINDEPFNGRLNMFQYWSLANHLDSEEEAIIDLYHNYLGKPLPEPQGKVLTKEEQIELQKQQRSKLLRLYALFFWNKTLFEEEGKKALEYLTQERKIPIEYVRRYFLGYAPGKKALTDFLLQMGFTLEEIKQEGLLSKKGFDLYWGRVMIPLFSERDNPLSPNFNVKNSDPLNFYSRALPMFIKNDLDKSLKHRYTNGNLPLFNFSEARRKRFAIMPEGCLDTIAGQVFIDRLIEKEKKGGLPEGFSIKPSEVGIFASFGTNGFSEQKHLPLVQRANFEILFLAGDEDENFAGQTANIKRARLIQDNCPQTKVRIIRLPKNDLNDLLISDYDPLDFLKLLEESVSLEEYEILVALKKCGPKNLRNSFEAIKMVEDLLNNLNLQGGNLIMYSKTIKTLAGYIGVDPALILFQVLTTKYKEKIKEEAEKNNVSVENLLMLKLAQLEDAFK